MKTVQPMTDWLHHGSNDLLNGLSLLGYNDIKIFPMKKILAPLIVLTIATSACSTRNMTFAEEMNQYSNDLIDRANKSISTPSNPEKTTDMPSYVITYVIEKDEIKTRKDGSTNEVSFIFNTAISKMWSDMFCTNELKSIMAKYDVFMVSGQLFGKDGARHSVSVCMK